MAILQGDNGTNANQKIPSGAFEEWKGSRIDENGFVERMPQENQRRFSWSNINVYKDALNRSTSLKNEKEKAMLEEKQILKNVSGAASPGELLIIMGPSGAGKTTLLNCMTFRNLKNFKVSGLICINDKPVHQTQLASESAYIQQDDMFVEYLTVKEHLIFQAMLKMDSSYSYEQKLDRVEMVMKELSLKKCEHCSIGSPGIKKGISGGERKRLALASEFLTNPSLLFCDEPTTGLDSFMALNVVQMLSSLAKSGRTVIATLHQPSSELFQLFDKICLISEGRTAFLGTTAEASSFFSDLHLPHSKNFNPADHYIRLLSIIPGQEKECKISVNRICDAFAASALGVQMRKFSQEVVKSLDTELQQWAYNHKNVIPYKVGWFLQMKILLWRSWISILRKPEVTTTKFINVIVEASFFAIIYYGQILDQYGIKNLDGVFAFYVTNVTYQNIYGTISTFCSEIPLFMKEHKDGMYRTDVYYLSKIICDMPFSCILAMLYPAIGYYFIGYYSEFSRYVTALLIMVLVSQAALGAGYIISVILPSLQHADVGINVIVFPSFIFGGFFLNIGSVPTYLQWLADLSWFKYGYESFMINQWYGISYIQCKTNSSECISDGAEVLLNASIYPGDFWIAVESLLGLIIGFRVIAFLCLLFRTYR